jgi:hypothetical protein
MFVDTDYIVTLTIMDIISDKKRIFLKTDIAEKASGMTTICGSAIVFYPNLESILNVVFSSFRDL